MSSSLHRLREVSMLLQEIVTNLLVLVLTYVGTDTDSDSSAFVGFVQSAECKLVE